VIALLALLACDGLTDQETWEVFAINDDLAVLDARLGTTNTGLLRGQGHVRFDWLFTDEVPVYHGRDGLPEEVEHLPDGGLRVGPDALSHDPESGFWQLEVRDEEARARLELRPTLGGPAPLTWEDGDGHWTVEAPVVLGDVRGYLKSGARDALVDGHAVIFHRHGDAAPTLAGQARHGVYILGDDLSIGLDQTGARATSWAIAGDLAFDARDARLAIGERGRMVIDLRPTADVVAHVLPRRPRSVRRPLEHLVWLERWLLRIWRGTPVRRVQGAKVRLLLGGQALEARGVIVDLGWE